MSAYLQPSSLLADSLQVKGQDGLTLFTLTCPAQARLDDLLNRRKDVGLLPDEQAQLDALSELDRMKREPWRSD